MLGRERSQRYVAPVREDIAATALLRAKAEAADRIMDDACGFIGPLVGREVKRPAIALDLSARAIGFMATGVFSYEEPRANRQGTVHLDPFIGVDDFYIATGLAMHNLVYAHPDRIEDASFYGMRAFREAVLRAGASLVGYLYQSRRMDGAGRAASILLGLGEGDNREYSRAIYRQARYGIVAPWGFDDERLAYGALMGLILKQNGCDPERTAGSLFSMKLPELKEGLVQFARMRSFSRAYSTRALLRGRTSTI